MLDVAPTELLLVALVALIVIGPKDLPRVMRVVGQWVGRARGVARHFRSGFDEMVRQSELDEMEKKWKAENERIMREHPQSDLSGDAEHAASPFRMGLIDDEPMDDVVSTAPVHTGGDATMAPLPPRAGDEQPR